MKACVKVRYETRAEARFAVRRLRGHGAATSGLRPYKCAACHFFHLGHLRPDVINGDRTRGEAY